jgi:ATP-binding cassette subfamily B protein
MAKEGNQAQKKNGSMKDLLPFLRPFRGWIVLLVVLGFVTNGAALMIPRTIGQAIDEYGSDTFSQSSIIWWLGGIIVFGLVAAIVQQILSTVVTERLARNMRNELASAVSQQSFSFIQKQSAAKLLTNFTSDIDQVKVIISQGLVTILSAVIMIFGSAAFLFTINVKLAFAALAVIPIILILFQVVMKKIRHIFREARANTDRLNKAITESILGATLVRVLAAQKNRDHTFDEANTQARDIGYRLLAVFGSFFPMLNLIADVAVVIVVWYGGWQVIDTQLTIGEFTAFYSYLAGLITPIFIIGFVSNIFVQAGVAFSRMHEVLTSKPVHVGGETVPVLQESVQFQNVSLSLGKARILKDVSFDIPFGKTTAIIGPTAAGKTHVLYLLLGLLETDEGSIHIDSISFDEIDRDAWLAECGVVFQDHVIFQGSLRENVTLGRDISEEAIWTALKRADLESFAQNLPNGLDTQVSERGTNLSGGQKQRVGLARALATEPSILFLDDFTARVDRATDKRIRDILKKSMPGQTRVVVSQTIESIRDADHIIVLMEGELIDAGTHEQLIARCFEYQQIAKSQETTDV